MRRRNTTREGRGRGKKGGLERGCLYFLFSSRTRIRPIDTKQQWWRGRERLPSVIKEKKIQRCGKRRLGPPRKAASAEGPSVIKDLRIRELQPKNTLQTHPLRKGGCQGDRGK